MHVVAQVTTLHDFLVGFAPNEGFGVFPEGAQLAVQLGISLDDIGVLLV